jgi:hypothetical protein
MLIKNQAPRLMDRVRHFRKNSKAFSQKFEINLKKDRGASASKTFKQGMGGDDAAR